MTEKKKEIKLLYDYEHKPTLFYRYSNGTTKWQTGYSLAKRNMKTRVKHKQNFTNVDATRILSTMFPYSETQDIIMEDFK